MDKDRWIQQENVQNIIRNKIDGVLVINVGIVDMDNLNIHVS